MTSGTSALFERPHRIGAGAATDAKRPPTDRNLQAAKQKLNELYISWLALPETQQLIAQQPQPPGIRVDSNGWTCAGGQ
eukprot:gene19749-8832_t